jgi:nitrate/nitrite transporter NarK
MAAGSFGLLALFARALGGWLSDKAAARGDLNSRVTLLFVLMVGEGLGLLWFSNADQRRRWPSPPCWPSACAPTWPAAPPMRWCPS